METIRKQSVGIDCSKDTLAVCFAQMNEHWKVLCKASHTFQNTPKGFHQLLRWAHKLADKEIPVQFVVEATGVYYEKLACFLFDAGKRVSVLLPNRARHFAQTLKTRTINDKEDARMLATLGLEKQLDAWQKPNPLFAQLKRITRERERLQHEMTQIMNQLHAEKHSAWSHASVIRWLQQRIHLLEKQMKEMDQEIRKLVRADADLQERIEKLCTIKGVGFLTAVVVVAETNGFHLFRSSKQLVSYTGYDVVTKESGISVHGKPRVSGKGNKHIRRALHFPALSHVQHGGHLKVLQQRIESKSGIPMKGYVAVQRKLLVLMYALWKKNEVFDKTYHTQKASMGMTQKEATTSAPQDKMPNESVQEKQDTSEISPVETLIFAEQESAPIVGQTAGKKNRATASCSTRAGSWPLYSPERGGKFTD